MSSTSEWLVCGLCGAKVRQLSNNPAHRKLLARLLVQEVANIPTRYTIHQMKSVNNNYNLRLCLVCTVKTQTVNEFQEFACKSLKIKVP